MQPAQRLRLVPPVFQCRREVPLPERTRCRCLRRLGDKQSRREVRRPGLFLVLLESLEPDPGPGRGADFQVEAAQGQHRKTHGHRPALRNSRPSRS